MALWAPSGHPSILVRQNSFASSAKFGFEVRSCHSELKPQMVVAEGRGVDPHSRWNSLLSKQDTRPLVFTFRGGKPRSRSPHVAVPIRFQRMPNPVRLTYLWRMSEVSIPNAQTHPFAFKAKSEAARNTHPWRRAVVSIHIPD